MKELLNHTVLTQKVVRILTFISVVGSLSACGNTTSPSAPTPTPPETSSAPKTDRSPSEPTTTPPKMTPEPTTNSATPDGKLNQTAQIYWLKDTGTKLEPVAASVPVQANANDPSSVLTAALERLLSPTASDPKLVSGIPAGTKLRSVAIESDGIYVDLSSEFTQGGGSAGIIGRLAQVLYTATSLDPKAAVWMRVNGEPLTSIGGEGIEIPQPLTRENFQQQFEL